MKEKARNKQLSLASDIASQLGNTLAMQMEVRTLVQVAMMFQTCYHLLVSSQPLMPFQEDSMQEEPGFAPQSRSRFKPPKDQRSPNVQGSSETRAGKRTRRRPAVPEVGRGEINSAIRVSERVSTGRRIMLNANLFGTNTATVAEFSIQGVGSSRREDG